jgi:hypothetical protein
VSVETVAEPSPRKELGASSVLGDALTLAGVLRKARLLSGAVELAGHFERATSFDIHDRN